MTTASWTCRIERRRAEELVAANRLYRQTAEESGEARVTELLDELERLLVDLAASPDTLSAEDLERSVTRIDANGLLFKVRVLVVGGARTAEADADTSWPELIAAEQHGT